VPRVGSERRFVALENFHFAVDGEHFFDEKKANRICAQRFPELRLASTVDIFMHPDVQSELGTEVLADTVFNALCRGRMRVFPQHVDWVIELIGVERARLCTSLPGPVRGSRQAAAGQAAGTGSKKISR
jgi:hypothetical protein